MTVTSPDQGPGDWDAGEGDWIDRVLDRAAERIASGEMFPEETAPRHVAPVARTASVATPDLPHSIVPLSGAISASDFSAAPVPVPGTEAPRSAQTPPPVLALGEDPPLTAQAIGRSAYTDGLAELREDRLAAEDPLPWVNDESPTNDRGNDGLEDDGGFAALSAPRERGVIREWGPVLVLAVAVAVIFRMFLFTAYHIPSLSMAPTLEVGDRVVVNRLSFQLGEIERGQVIVFSRPPGQVGQAEHLIKRVIGLPGDTVSVSNGHIWIDGNRLSEPYLAQEESSEPRTAAIPGCVNDGGSRTECVVPAGSVFVMGDNRRGSVDSRVFGPIDQESIVGRAFVRIWVLDNVGWL